ncbi:hypothetical protein GCM10009610_59290 [Pseudonocardia xinjiangensis]
MHTSTNPTLPNPHLGTAPGSWGVWSRMTLPRSRAPVPRRGRRSRYTAVELGPWGYLPTHAEHLRDELGSRGLTLTGATAGTALHRGAEALSDARTRPRAA